MPTKKTWIPIAAAVAVGGAVVVVVATHRSPAPAATVVRADDLGRQADEFRCLKADADALASAGDRRGALEKYRAVESLAGSHPVSDPAVARLIAESKSAGDALLFGPVATSTRPTTPPDVTPAVAVVPATDPVPTTAPVETAAAPSVDPVRSPVVASATPVAPDSFELPGRTLDKRVGQALDAGVEFLLKQFQDGQINDGLPPSDVRHQGLDAMCVYALLEAGRSTNDSRLGVNTPLLRQMIATLKAFSMKTDPAMPPQPVVFARSLRASALAVYARPQDAGCLRNDIAWLIDAQTDGTYCDDDRYATGSYRSHSAPLEAVDAKRSYPQTRPAKVDISRIKMPGRPHCVPTRASILAYQSAMNEYRRKVNAALNPGSPRQAGGPDVPLQSDTESTPVESEPRPWNNFNSQCGLMGVWAGAEAGVPVPASYWTAVQRHWSESQLPGGQWKFDATDDRPSLEMTSAGVMALFVCRDYLEPMTGGRVGRRPVAPQLDRGLKWLSTGDNAATLLPIDMDDPSFTAYSVEQAAIASGFKFFGSSDWFAELSTRLIPYQSPTGAWGESGGIDAAQINTAYMVLFLARGRGPVLMNKLRFDGPWDNHPHDAANLARYAGSKFERSLRCQVVDVDRPWSDWADAPILYIAGHKAPNLKDADVDKLRDYVSAGGMIFTNADAKSPAMNQWVEQLATKLWPGGRLVDVPDDHPLYGVNYRLTPGVKDAPRLKMVASGTRVLLVHSPTNLTQAWQDNFTRRPEPFETGLNLFVYAAGKSQWRNRLDTRYIPEPVDPPTGSVQVVRLNYDGGDPEPYAWTRFGRYYQWATGSVVKLATTRLADLGSSIAPVATLTGTAETGFTDADAAAVRTYVGAGGTLLVDCCGGSDAFAKSAERLLAKAFPEAKLDAMSDDDRVVAGLGPPAALPFVVDQGLPSGPPKIISFGPHAGRVIYSRLDLTTGLLGTMPWGVAGYSPDYAERFVRNVLLTARKGG